MKITFLLPNMMSIVLFTCVVSGFAQVKLGYDHYSQDYIHVHGIKSITEVQYKASDFPFEDIDDMSHYVNRRIVFDTSGKVIEDKYPNSDNEEGWVRGYAGYEREEIVEVKDSNDRIVERKYFYNEKYRNSELFEHDSVGNVIKVLNKYDDSIYVHLELFYDKRGNNIKTIAHSTPSVQKIVRTFTMRNQLVTEKKYGKENQIKHLDSSVYDSIGNMTARYYFDYREGQQILSDRYEFKYDSLSRKVWWGRFDVKSGEVNFHREIQYNEQGNKSGRIDYLEGKVSSQYVWKYEYFEPSD